MAPYLRLGPVILQLAPLVILVGIWLGTLLVEKEAGKLKLQASQVSTLVFVGLAAGVLGARLAYAARYLGVYLENPLSLFSINTNTLASFEGTVIGLAAASLYGWRKKLPLRQTLDALAPGIALFLLSLGVAHLLSGDAYGAPANLPWSVYLWNEYRHPAQVYEILAAVGILVVTLRKPAMLPGMRARGTSGAVKDVPAGIQFLMLVALSAAARIFLEAFRGDSVILPGGFRLAQVLGVIILAVSLVLIGRWGVYRPGGGTVESPPAEKVLPDQEAQSGAEQPALDEAENKAE